LCRRPRDSRADTARIPLQPWRQHRECRFHFSARRGSHSAFRTPHLPERGHFPAKARNCIFLMMEGGPSHIDTFDPKPKLAELHLKEFVREGKQKSAMESGKRYYVRSLFNFIKAGQSGADLTENWKHLAN
jgi:hypothetical protein